MPARSIPPLLSLATAAALALAGLPAIAEARDPAAPGAAIVAATVTEADLARLSEVLALPDLFAIVAREGLAYGNDLRESLFPDRAAASWDSRVAEIYDPARMLALFLPELAGALGKTPIAPILAYFGSDEGRQILALELAARAAIIDPAVEQAARDRWQAIADAGGPFAERLRAFVHANDLIEANVAGTLNSNLAFYSGLADGGGAETPAEDILASVLAQEAEVRAETEAWVYGYLALAYEPLPVGALDRYIAFSLTPEGQALNTALFAAFDTLFVDISRQLGRAAAVRMASEEL